MAGHIKPRKDGKGRTRYQARIRNPLNPSKDIVQTFDRRGDARDWLTAQASAVQLGNFIDPRRASRPAREVVGAWRETWADLEPKTRVGYESMLTTHFLPVFGDAPIGKITAHALQAHFNARAEALAPKTLRNVYGVFSGVFRVAVEHRYIPVSPLDPVKLPKGKRKRLGGRMLHLSPQEVAQLADAMPSPRLRVAVLLAAYQGPRAGELWALRRRDIDPLRRQVYFVNAIKEINSSAATLDGEKGLVLGPPKSGEDRNNRLPQFLVDELAALLAEPSPAGRDGVLVIRETDDGPQFARSPDPFDPDAVVFATERGYAVRHNSFYKRTFRPLIVGRAALPAKRGRRARPAVPGLWPEGHRLHKLRWHDLRHTAAALSLAVEPNLLIVKERLGHGDIRTTVNTYGHLLPSVEERLTDGLDELYARYRADADDDSDTPGNVAELHPRPGDEQAEAA